MEFILEVWDTMKDVTPEYNIERESLVAAIAALRARQPMPARKGTAQEPTKDINGGIFGKGTTIWFCPKCGIFNTPSHKFCWACGQALSFDIPAREPKGNAAK